MLTDPTVDIVILTVLPEEYEAVRQRLFNCASTSTSNLYAWVVGEISTPRFGKAYSVVLGMVGRAGNISGALATIEAIHRWNPRYLLFVGIAGGFDLDELKKGDVVIADVIYGYEYGKLEGKKFIPRQEQTYHSDQGLVNLAVKFALSNTNWARSIQADHPAGQISKVIKGNIASGEKVVDDPTNAFFAEVQKGWSKLHAVEMEGAGAAAAIDLAYSHGLSVRFLMIRGISDMPRPDRGTGIRGTQERDLWKVYAANATAAFTVSFIADGLPELPSEPVIPSGDKLAAFGLLDENDEAFGKSEFTSNLGFHTSVLGPLSPASHYVILAVLPLDRVVASTTEVLKTARNMLERGEWYSRRQRDAPLPPKSWPYAIFNIPTSRRAARDALFWEDKDPLYATDLVLSRLAITGSAEVVFASAINLVYMSPNEISIFGLGPILVRCWGLSGLVAQLYYEIGYAGKTYLCIGMVNTLNSHLGGNANGWPEPYESRYRWYAEETRSDWSCHSLNLKFCEMVDLMNMRPKEQPEFLKRFADAISLAYNHDNPRCFDEEGLIPRRYFKR